jgi:hypothetical protein
MSSDRQYLHKIISAKDADLLLKIAVGVSRTEYWGQGVIRCKGEDKKAG